MSINMHSLAAAVVRESGSSDPDAMVDDLVSRIDPADYRDAIRYLGRDLIRRVIHGQRASLNGPRRATGSRKVDAAREAWKRLLDTPEYLPSTGWIFLRDASREQVLEMAGVRRQKSQELSVAAKRYSAIASEMQKAKVLRAGDLDDSVLERLLAPAKGEAA